MKKPVKICTLKLVCKQCKGKRKGPYSCFDCDGKGWVWGTVPGR